MIDRYIDLTPEKAQELGNAKRHVMELAATMNAERIGRNHWCDKEETLLRVTAILESASICLKAGYAFGF
jgi:hypothetical protein